MFWSKLSTNRASGSANRRHTAGIGSIPKAWRAWLPIRGNCQGRGVTGHIDASFSIRGGAEHVPSAVLLSSCWVFVLARSARGIAPPQAESMPSDIEKIASPPLSAPAALFVKKKGGAYNSPGSPLLDSIGSDYYSLIFHTKLNKRWLRFRETRPERPSPSPAWTRSSA